MRRDRRASVAEHYRRPWAVRGKWHHTEGHVRGLLPRTTAAHCAPSVRHPEPLSLARRLGYEDPLAQLLQAEVLPPPAARSYGSCATRASPMSRSWIDSTGMPFAGSAVAARPTRHLRLPVARRECHDRRTDRHGHYASHDRAMSRNRPVLPPSRLHPHHRPGSRTCRDVRQHTLSRLP